MRDCRSAHSAGKRWKALSDSGFSRLRRRVGGDDVAGQRRKRSVGAGVVDNVVRQALVRSEHLDHPQQRGSRLVDVVTLLPA
jgi:hypothetical protein